MAGRVAGKVVIVTGAAQGIGRACADLLAREGAHVVLSDIQADKGEAAAAALRAAGGSGLFQHADVADSDQCAALIDHTMARFGRLDGLVNNAGWFPRATLQETTLDLWDAVLNVNLRGAFLLCQRAMPAMETSGGGSVVNIGSINGIQGLPNLVAYAAAKGGLLALTRTLAGAYAHARIRHNYVIPGWVLSEGELALQAARGVSTDDLARAGAALALGRHQAPTDTAYAVLYLISDESSQVTGTVMHVDAGATSLPIAAGTPYVG